MLLFFFFFNDTATTEIYTLSLHDALPISLGTSGLDITTVGFGAWAIGGGGWAFGWGPQDDTASLAAMRSEEHTSELQSRSDLVCRLLLEKKKKKERENRCTDNQ